MSSPFPEEVESALDPAETGRSGCLLPEIEDDSGHCDSAEEDEDDE